MPQFARPMADTFNGDSYVDQVGGSTDIFEAIDEDEADDADFIRSPNSPVAFVYVTKLTTVEDPGSDASHVIRARMKKDLTNPNTLNVDVELREGYVDEGTQGTLIATLVQTNISNEFVNYEKALSEGEAALITDYTDLYLRFIANP